MTCLLLWWHKRKHPAFTATNDEHSRWQLFPYGGFSSYIFLFLFFFERINHITNEAGCKLKSCTESSCTRISEVNKYSYHLDNSQARMISISPVTPTQREAHDLNWLHKRAGSKAGSKAGMRRRKHSPTQPARSRQGWRGKANNGKLFGEHFNVDF